MRAASGGGSPAAEATRTDRARVARRRPLRVVVGAAILVAIGLLWPFAEWSWWPVVIGFGVLVLLFVSRLDGLLRGWAPHLAGLVVVVLLLGRTGPWVWGFAAGLALLGYGLVRLPDWRVAAVGVALTVLFGSGYGISQYRSDAQLAAEHARTSADQARVMVAIYAEQVVTAMTPGVAAGDAESVRTVCDLLGPAAAQFAREHAKPDCASAVSALHAEVRDPGGYGSPTRDSVSIVKSPDGATVDACHLRWTAEIPPGPQLGHFELRRHQADRYLIVGYLSCH